MNNKYSTTAMKSVNSSIMDGFSSSDDLEVITEQAVEPWIEPPPYEPDLSNFNLYYAWCAIFNLPTCCEVMLTHQMQRRLHVVVGRNVTQEFPWRRVSYGRFREVVLMNFPQGHHIRDVFKGYNQKSPILLGYVPILTQHMETQPEGDPFVFFVSPVDTKTAVSIIKNIESYENWLYRKSWLKQGYEWQEFGSASEVQLLVEYPHDPNESVEVQSVYPVKHTGARELSMRYSDMVRDGLAELIPAANVKYDLINRCRLSIGTQVLPFRFEKSQQTIHEFPTNAFTQYDATMEVEDDKMDLSESEEERERGIKRGSTDRQPKQPVILSRKLRRLLASLEFSTVDFYRNDYAGLYEKRIQQYQEPHLEEAICFADIAKTNQRFICAVDWYPKRSGLLVASYVFSTVASRQKAKYRVDLIQRAVLQPNPVLLWSFADNLCYKIEFHSPREVTSISFCPFEAHVLVGGMNNGQVCLWDLQSRITQMDQEEFLTAAQSRYRHIMRDYLKDTIYVNEEYIVSASALSALDVSHKAAVTSIHWLGRQWYVNAYGKFYEDTDKDARHKCFISCALDGTLFFWDLDKLLPKKQDDGHHKHLPKSLSQSESRYKRLVLKPLFTIGFKEPLTAFIADTSTVRYIQRKEDREEAAQLESVNTRTVPMILMPKEMRQSVIISSMYGRLERLTWAGLYTDVDAINKLSSAQSFARVHDGPVICAKKNPFIPRIFLSIGRTVFAIWREDFHYSPILWRKRSNDLTAATWSLDRPSVFFLTRTDGSIEVWDIMARDDHPCLESILGGGRLTSIIEHGPAYPEKLLGVGDYNSSFRMVKLPPSYFTPLPNETERFEQLVAKEVTRKRFIQTWEENYFKENRDFILAKRVAEAESRKEIERVEKENEMMQRISKISQEQIDLPQKPLSYSERMARAWEDLNVKRLTQVLLSRLQMDSERLKRETVLWKKLLAYEDAKKKAYEETMKRIDKVLSNLRLCLLPEEVIDTTHIELIGEMVDRLLDMASLYDDGADESREYLSLFGTIESFDFTEFLERGVHRRRLMNNALGASTERQYWYEMRRTTDRLDESIWGYQFYTNDYDTLDEEEGGGDSTMPFSSRLGGFNFDDSPTPTSIAEKIDDNDDEDEENMGADQYAIDLLEYADPVKKVKRV